MTAAPNAELWTATEQQLLRAERLLAHGVDAVRQQQLLRRQDRDQIAFELQQLLLPLEGLSAALVAVIEEMAQHRQDNRLQRWQGRLQQQLDPLDEELQRLREQVVLLDQPLEHEQSQASAAAQRERRKQQQLVELLGHRQKQVMALQLERRALQLQLFEAEQQLAALRGADQTPATDDQPSTPSIFS
jgi:hypothetical protein